MSLFCLKCSDDVQAAVKKLDGIAKVEASVEKKNAIISFNPKKTTSEAIGKKIESVGYKSTKQRCSKIGG